MSRVVVPVAATEEMFQAARDDVHGKQGFLRIADTYAMGYYKAMLAAAPPYEPSEAEVEAGALAIYNTIRAECGLNITPNHPYWPCWAEQRHTTIIDRCRASARAALIAADKARRG